jgi:glycosyltransferase involved in cell wall biosynthesis
MNIVIGDVVAARLKRSGVPAHRIRVIHNWADGEAVRPLEPGRNSLRASWDLSEAFVVGYSGNLGRAHEFATILNAICRLEAQTTSRSHPAATAADAREPSQETPRIIWLFVGGGAGLEALKKEVTQRGLRSVIFKPYQPRSCLAESLSAADVHLISLRPELEGLIVPSKYYGIAAAGRPAIFIGSREGEIGKILAEHRTGFTVPIGDGEELAREIGRLASAPLQVRDMGQRARALFDAEYKLEKAVNAWSAVLEDVETSTSGDRTIGSAA